MRYLYRLLQIVQNSDGQPPKGGDVGWALMAPAWAIWALTLVAGLLLALSRWSQPPHLFHPLAARIPYTAVLAFICSIGFAAVVNLATRVSLPLVEALWRRRPAPLPDPAVLRGLSESELAILEDYRGGMVVYLEPIEKKPRAELEPRDRVLLELRDQGFLVQRELRRPDYGLNPRLPQLLDEEGARREALADLKVTRGPRSRPSAFSS